MQFRTLPFLFLLLLLWGSSVDAASQQPDEKPLSDNWYVMSIQHAQGASPFGYYNEKVELKKGRLFYQTHIWKQEENYINEEQLGAYAENNATLTPLFYNFHSNYRTTEIIIDGTVNAGKLSVRYRKGNHEPSVVKRSLSKHAFFVQFFPLWISKNLPELKKGRNLGFYAIVEDNPELGFASISGRAKIEKNELLSQLPGTFQLAVQFNNQNSKWWLEETGIPVRIEMIKSNIISERTTKEKAQNFLK